GAYSWLGKSPRVKTPGLCSLCAPAGHGNQSTGNASCRYRTYLYFGAGRGLGVDSTCGTFVCGTGVAVPVLCGFSFGGVRRNFTDPCVFPSEMTTSKSLGSGFGRISTIRRLSLLGWEVIFCTSFVSVFCT